MIRRAPRPGRGFLILHNEVARDSRLSYRASGVLHDILSRPDNWTATAEQLAKARPAGEGVKAIRTALRELEAAGYLKRERVRGEDGRFSWSQTVYDFPRTDVPTASDPAASDTDSDGVDVSAGQTISPFPPGGSVQGGNRPSKEEPRRSTDKNNPVLSCTDSGRSAPYVGGEVAANDNDSTEDETTGDDWRVEDQQRFVDLIGDTLRSDGSRWTEGVFSTLGFYKALRQRKPNPVPWPGLWLEGALQKRPGMSVDDWLDEHGLEVWPY